MKEKPAINSKISLSVYAASRCKEVLERGRECVSV